MIFLVGYYGFGNVGDEAILSTIVRQLRDRLPNLPITVASGNPEETIASHGVDAVAWNDISAIHRAVQDSDLVAIGGGGLFHDYWGVDPDSFLTGRHWGVAYYAGPAMLATLYRKPVMLYAVGVGPLYSAHGIKFTYMVAQAAQAITVRDEASKALLGEIGVAAERVRVTADPGFAFQPAGSFGLADALDRTASETEFVLHKPILGVAPRHWAVGVHPDFLERELAAALDLYLRKTGGSVVLVPFQHISGEKENDRATAARIMAQMRYRDRVAVASLAVSPYQVYGCLRDCDAVLGMRLHALIFAAKAGVPAVSLSYDPKVDAIVKRLGLEKYSLDVKGVEAATLAQQLLYAMDHRSDFAQATELANGELAEAASYNVSIALALRESLPAEAGVRLKSFDVLRFRAVEEENRALNRDLGEAHRQVRALEEEKASAETARAAAEAEAEAAAQTAEAAAKAAEAAVQAAVANGEAAASHLTAQLQRESGQRRVAESAVEQGARQLHETRQEHERERIAVLAELDRFHTVYRSQLAAYRSERAWTVMVVIRKAYTLLFHRSLGAFLRWAAGLLVGRTGPLQEYDLHFPDLAAYIPDTFRRPAAAAEAPAAQTAAQAPPPAAEPAPLDAAPSTQVRLEGPAQRDRYDVLVLAIIDFDFRFQRPQQLAAEFARRGHRVFWISPTRFLPESSPDAYAVLPLRDNLWEIHLRSRQPDIYMGDLKPGDIQSLSTALDRFYRDWTVGEHTVLVQLPFWRRLALKLRARFGSTILYDCMDDWETFENMGKFNVSEEKHFVRECDVLVVTGAELERKFLAQGLHPVLARNGADYPFFSKARPNDLLAGVSKPIVGYFGAIADWIDLDLVLEVARSRPQYSFVLIGQVFGRDTSQLEALPNVRLLGSKPYADIPAYLYNFDACLIPFLLNQVTKATDPVKLYEYFALGKPVVATDMAELAQCGDLLYIGHNPEDFAQKVDAAVSEISSGRAAELTRGRIDFARANTWSSRADLIDRAVHEAFPLVSIVIVSYNSAPFVRPCLDSILRNTAYPSYEVVMVDNASSDSTAAILKEYADRDARFHLLALAENTGFAGGNNYGVGQARGKYLIFLNCDTMVTGGWIEGLLRHLRQDPSIGLLCPVTNFAGNEIKINVSYTAWQGMEQFARRLSAARSGERFAIQVAPLYCAIMPRTVWDEVGELDTRYEIGMFEDDDLACRVRQAGYGVFAAEDCFIHHFGQGAFSKLEGETYNRIFEANRRRFEEKWKQPWVAHRTRPGVRPAFEERRFEPGPFLVPAPPQTW